MAKKKGKGSSKPVASEESTLLMPSTNDVVSLARKGRQTKNRTQELAGEFGQAVANAVEKKHLDRTAFSIARRLEGMSDEKLHFTYFHLLRYMDDLKIPERARAQAEMFEEGSEAEGKEHGVRGVVAGRDVEEAAGAAT